MGARLCEPGLGVFVEAFNSFLGDAIVEFGRLCWLWIVVTARFQTQTTGRPGIPLRRDNEHQCGGAPKIGALFLWLPRLGAGIRRQNEVIHHQQAGKGGA